MTQATLEGNYGIHASLGRYTITDLASGERFELTPSPEQIADVSTHSHWSGGFLYVGGPDGPTHRVSMESIRAGVPRWQRREWTPWTDA